jgi:hypothetical protein
MAWIVNIPAHDGIVVDVFQLLKHHVRVGHLLRLAPFLPDLVVALRLVPKLVGAKLAEQHFGLPGTEQNNDLPGRVHLETLHGIRQGRRGGNQV